MHDRLQKRRKEQEKKGRINPKERFGTNDIKTKHSATPSQNYNVQHFHKYHPPAHHPPTFLITRSNTLPKQRWRKKFGLDIVSHNSPVPPCSPRETRIHRDKTNPCPDKWRLAGTVLKGREFETTINPGQRLINRRPKPLARRAR